MDRRTFLAGIPVVTAAATGLQAEAATGTSNAVPARLIATEEGFALPETQAATRAYLSEHAAEEPGFIALSQGFGPDQSQRWFRELVDFDALRVGAMEAAGITTQLLLHGSPGVQLFGPDQGTELARLVNDRMADLARSNPQRYAPLITIAPQDPERAALELERGFNQLGLHGGLINSHTKGEYLDDPKFWPIFEAAEALGAPLYLHPREPAAAMLEPYRAHSLVGPMWGFAADTGLHALRLIMAGVFDRFPRLQIVLGHLGEGLPFFIDRVDIRYIADGSPSRVRLRKSPSDYLRSNFHLTTSGMNWWPAIQQSLAVIGEDRIMFAADWPFEDATDAAARFQALPIPPATREKLAFRNAERLFRIAPLTV